MVLLECPVCVDILFSQRGDSCRSFAEQRRGTVRRECIRNRFYFWQIHDPNWLLPFSTPVAEHSDCSKYSTLQLVDALCKTGGQGNRREPRGGATFWNATLTGACDCSSPKRPQRTILTVDTDVQSSIKNDSSRVTDRFAHYNRSLAKRRLFSPTETSLHSRSDPDTSAMQCESVSRGGGLIAPRVHFTTSIGHPVDALSQLRLFICSIILRLPPGCAL